MSDFSELEQFKNYQFIDPGEMGDADLELILRETSPYIPEKGFVPAYNFSMVHTTSKEIMGNIDLRVGLTEKLKEYGGHIGYEVFEPYRGHRYAARSCSLLFPFLRKLGINPVVITCDPNNLPSKKTIESLGAVLIETKQVEVEPGVFRLTSVYHIYI
ncbi:MAG: GNAT family N-acetyltransferase [Anaerolineales bacterium]